MNQNGMTDLAPLERRVAAWMTDEVSGPPPTHELDRILTATSRIRPQPRWLALLKEPPMQTQARVVAGLPARRLLVMAAVLGLLIVALAAALTGFGSKPAAPRATAAFAWKASAPGLHLIPPSNLAFDPQGNIWTPDHENGRFAIFKPDGTFVAYWGSPGTGDGQFNLKRPNGDGYGGIAIESDGSFYVLDVGNFRVQAFDAGRGFVRQWGSPGSGPGQYNDPVAIVTGVDGSVYILDDGRGVVEHYDRSGAVLGTVTVLPPNLRDVSTNGLAVDAAGNLYVTMAAQPWEVLKLDPSGHQLAVFGATGPGEFTEQPSQVAFDTAGRLYVTQGPNRAVGAPGVLVFAPDGPYITGFGPPGSGPGQLVFPTGILLDGKGNLYVADPANPDGTGSIEKFVLGPPLAP